MPTPVDGLTAQSSPDQIRKAIGECVKVEMDNGREQTQAVAMCISMAKGKTGQEYPKKSTEEGGQK